MRGAEGRLHLALIERLAAIVGRAHALTDGRPPGLLFVY